MSLPSLPDFFVPMGPGEDKRIKEFYQSRGLERVIQPAGDGESSIQKHTSPTFPGIQIRLFLTLHTAQLASNHNLHV